MLTHVDEKVFSKLQLNQAILIFCDIKWVKETHFTYEVRNTNFPD